MSLHVQVAERRRRSRGYEGRTKRLELAPYTLCSHPVFTPLFRAHLVRTKWLDLPFPCTLAPACVHTSPPCTPCPHTPGHTIVVAAATAVEATEEVEAAPANQRRLSRGYADHTLTVAAAKAAEAVEEVREL